MQGYIKLHRQLCENDLWTCERFSKGQAWVDLLLMANHKDKKIIMDGQFVLVRRGSFITSIRKLADRWQWSVNTVKAFLNLLESDGMLTRESTNQCTRINIRNYAKFQGSSDFDDTRTDTPIDTRTDTRTAHALTPNKNDKNDKNDKKYNKGAEKFFDDPELNSAFLDYVKMRKDIKKPMSDRAITLAKNTLDKLAKDDTQKKIKILEQSIFYSWAGLFELKEDKKTTAETKTPKTTNSFLQYPQHDYDYDAILEEIKANK